MTKRKAHHVLNHVTEAPLCHGPLQEVGGAAIWEPWRGDGGTGKGWC